MVVRHIRPEDFAVSRWSGGETSQVAIGPDGARYGDRDFLWRVSSATVTLEESVFTPLPDYWRYLTVLEGTIRIRHNGGDAVELSPGKVHSFDGGEATTSQGICRDFNLMVRKGRCTGVMEYIHVEGGRAVPASGDVHIFYCVSGGLHIGGVTLEKGEAAEVQGTEETLDLTGTPAAVALHCAISF